MTQKKNNNMFGVWKGKETEFSVTPIEFKHPRTNKNTWYLMNNEYIFEMQTYKDEKPASLFIDDFVLQENTMYLINKIEYL